METKTISTKEQRPAVTKITRFSWFADCYQPTPAGAVTLDQLFRIMTAPESSTPEIKKAASIVYKIRAGELNKEDKLRLPAFTSSAVIRNNKGSYTPDKLIEYSGYTQIDIDATRNPDLLTCQADAELLRDTLSVLPFVKLAAISASGLGVWLLVPVPDGKLKQYFKAYVNYFKSTLNINVDTSKGTKENQLRFFAPDKGAILNRDCQPIALPPAPAATPKPMQPAAKGKPIETELSPIADYNQRGDIVAELQRHGWAIVSKANGKTRLKSSEGQHKFNSEYDSNKNSFYNWSDHDTPFEPNRGYTPASTWALLNNIDPENPSELNKALRAIGYGNKQSGRGYFQRIEAAKHTPPQQDAKGAFLSDLVPKCTNIPDTGETQPKATVCTEIRQIITHQFTHRLTPEVWLSPGKTEAEILTDLQILTDDCRINYGLEVTPDEYYQTLKNWQT